MERVSVTCRLEPDDVAFLDKLAELMDRDRSYLIKTAVADFIAQQKWQVEEVGRSLTEMEDGKFLTESQFDADMKSW